MINDLPMMVKQKFIEQYDAAKNLQLPSGYAFMKNGQLVLPNLMQSLIASKLQQVNSFGNWSGTGAGKTLAAILASRCTNSKVTLIIGTNSTMLDDESGWSKEIKDSFPDVLVFNKEKTIETYTDKPIYILWNYETFQQSGSTEFVDTMLNKYHIDFIILDEIHCTKSRNDSEDSKRRQVIMYLLQQCRNKNENVKIHGMSATPVINDLKEGVSLLEMITGKKFDDIDLNSRRIDNALNLHVNFINNGVRYLPSHGVSLNEKCVPIYGNIELSEEIINLPKGSIINIEQILLREKLETIVNSCRKGTIVYTHYIKGMVAPIVKRLEKEGFKVGKFTGEDKTGLDNFKSGNLDVLVASSTVGTGIDGLQKISNNMVIACLPWTSAMWEQLVGRLIRQGSSFSEVNVIIPQVILMNPNDGSEWSWDKQRLKRIHYKRTLANAAVDGIIPEGILESEQKLIDDAKIALKEWINRLENGNIHKIEREDIEVLTPEDTNLTCKKTYGDFSEMNRLINTSKSSTNHERFTKNPDEWREYHRLYTDSRSNWTEIPYQVFSEELKKRSQDKVIGDFGCGERLLGKSLSNNVISFDHIPIDDHVTVCDMSNTNLNDNTLDFAIFSLSLMGINWEDYLVEAYRTLKQDGQIWIAEPASRWENISDLTIALEKSGFELIGQVKYSDKWVYIKGVKS